MANLTCLNILQVCHLRALRLGPDGSVTSGEDVRYEHTAPILFGYTPQTPDRETFTQEDGCGNECAFFQAPPKPVNSAELQLELCQMDAELMELLLGGSLITDGDDTIGYLSNRDDTLNEYGTAIETWSKAWNRRERAIRNGQPAYFRHVFPLTRWTQDQSTLDNSGFATITLSGTAEVNSGFETGWDEDPEPVDIGTSVYGWWLDDQVPDGECGYQPVTSPTS